MNSHPDKLGNSRPPPGLERRILKRLPLATALSILVSLALPVLARMFPPDAPAYDVLRATKRVDFFATSLVLVSLTAIFTVFIGCMIVVIMKGPAYFADSYEVQSSDRPVIPSADSPDSADR